MAKPTNGDSAAPTPNTQPIPSTRHAQPTDIDPTSMQHLRTALSAIETRTNEQAPSFYRVWSQIESHPSPMAQPQWSAAHSFNIACALIWAQLRILPWLIIPMAAISATLAVLAGMHLGVGQGAGAAVSGFTAVMLIGVILTFSAALTHHDRHGIAKTMPVGPGAVLLAQVAMVLIIDVACGVGASWVLSLSGVTDGFGQLLASWMIPLAALMGIVTFFSVWIRPWAGVTFGLAALPLITSLPKHSGSFGVSVMSVIFTDALAPIMAVTLGIALVALAMFIAQNQRYFTTELA